MGTPMYVTFLMVKLNPYKKYTRSIAILFMVCSAVKQCIMLTAHAASVWNYRLFFDPNTFRLRDVSTADWNSKPYLVNRLTDRDLWLNVDWTTIVMWFLPPAWVIICAAQVYNTHLQFKIGRYVVRQCDAKGAAQAKEEPKASPTLLQTLPRLRWHLLRLRRLLPPTAFPQMCSSVRFQFGSNASRSLPRHRHKCVELGGTAEQPLPV